MLIIFVIIIIIITSASQPYSIFILSLSQGTNTVQIIPRFNIYFLIFHFYFGFLLIVIILHCVSTVVLKFNAMNEYANLKETGNNYQIQDWSLRTLNRTLRVINSKQSKDIEKNCPENIQKFVEICKTLTLSSSKANAEMPVLLRLSVCNLLNAGMK